MRKTLLFILVILLTASLSAACTGSGATDSGASSGRTSLRYAASDFFMMNDPHYQYRSVDNLVSSMVYEPLMYFDNFGNFEPRVSTSYEVSDDGLVYTIHLRHGVKFHSGGEMKASDVLFSIERAKKAPTMQINTEPIAKVEAPDDYTVVITLKEINPMFHSLCNFGIMSEEAGKDLAPGFFGANVGTGAWLLTEFKGDEKIAFKRNEDWYMPLPEVETLEVYAVTDVNTMIMAFEAGDLDFIGVTAAEYERLANTGKYTMYSNPYYHTTFINFNEKVPPFDNVLVRKAFNYAINQEDVMRGAMKGLADRAYYIGNRYYITYLPDPASGLFETYPYDPAKARELLAEAGYPDGLHIDEPTMVLPIQHYITANEIMQQQLAEAGIYIEIAMGDPSTHYSDHVNGNYHFGMQGWDWIVSDWYWTERIFSTGGIGDANMTFYSNPVVDELYEKARHTADQEKRVEYFTEIIRILSEDAVIVPLYHRHVCYAWNKNLNADPNRPISEWHWN